MNLKAGQVIAKESFPKWYEIHQKILYWAIRRYQKGKWGKNYRATHVYIVLKHPHEGVLWLFEQTWPVARWTPIDYLSDKTFAICRYEKSLNTGAMVQEAMVRLGRKYDIGDLIDFGFSGIVLGVYKKVFRFVGDKARRLGVCSTVVAAILKAGGCEIEPETTTPAYYENAPGWNVIARYKKGVREELTDAEN